MQQHGEDRRPSGDHGELEVVRESPAEPVRTEKAYPGIEQHPGPWVFQHQRDEPDDDKSDRDVSHLSSPCAGLSIMWQCTTLFRICQPRPPLPAQFFPVTRCSCCGGTRAIEEEANSQPPRVPVPGPETRQLKQVAAPVGGTVTGRDR